LIFIERYQEEALMQSGTPDAPASKTMLCVGRVISALMIVFMLVDGGIKILKLQPAVEGTTRLGYPVSVVQPIGILALVCVILYAIPRDRYPGARPGSMVPFSRCYWRAALGRTLFPRCPAACAYPPE
jgi:hypothetical protein